MTNKVKERDRKIGVMVMLSAREIEFLDRKIKKNDPEKKSRSALIQLLIRKAMMKPELFDTGWEGS
jgi:hypothetical protein